MTLLDHRGALKDEGTGPLLGENLVRALDVPASPSANVSEPGADVMARARRLRSQWGAASPQKVALLGILMARLAEVPFDDVAALLGVRPSRLEKLIHGEEQIPANVVDRWSLLADAVGDLHAVLDARATARWIRTSVPALGGRTPLECATRGRIADVRELTASYRDEAFS
jgi:hypothetical protein